MDIINYRPEFVIYVIEADGAIKNAISDALASARFQVESFSSAEEALHRIKLSPPHMIFGATSLEFIQGVRNLSNDIEFVFLTRSGNKKDGVEALRRGAFWFLEKPFVNLAEVVSVADRIVEIIYLRMENEQLLAQGTTSTGSIDSILNFSKVLGHSTEPEQVLKTLCDEVSKSASHHPVLFLKYLPAYQSLTITASAQIPLESLKDVGIKLSNQDPRNIPALLSEPQRFQELKELMIEVFKCPDFLSLPVNLGGSPIGLVVCFGRPENFEKLFKTFVTVAEFAYFNSNLSQKVQDLAQRDSLTGLYNRKSFQEKIEEEMNRSRRTHYPLSIIYLEIDHFKNFNEANGFVMGDIILKSVSQILAKTSRKIDTVARLGNEEFAILCPHTPAVGAAVKAEKIRLTIEQTRFPNGESQPLGKITVSVGVSEYPGVVNTSDLLLRTAADALFKVKEGGRNRVCLAEPPRGFKGDFESLPVPGFQIFPENRSQQSI